jgi:hypothetical protein
MTRRLGGSRRVSGAEIDNVIEHDAGLRSLADASRMLRMEPADVLALIDRGAFPDAYQVEGHWRIPVQDIRRVLRSGAGDVRGVPAPLAALVRRRRPYERSHRPSDWLTPGERRELIAQRLARRSGVRTSMLSAELGVSQMTIRRDLMRMEAEGRLVRTYGGALAPGSRALVPATAQAARSRRECAACAHSRQESAADAR